jgi:hypothetical protein
MKRMEVHCIDTYEDSTMKPTKHCLQVREEGKRNGNIVELELAQGTPHACMESSQ